MNVPLRNHPPHRNPTLRTAAVPSRPRTKARAACSSVEPSTSGAKKGVVQPLEDRLPFVKACKPASKPLPIISKPSRQKSSKLSVPVGSSHVRAIQRPMLFLDSLSMLSSFSPTARQPDSPPDATNLAKVAWCYHVTKHELQAHHMAVRYFVWLDQ